ncbi:MAG: SulP family inorganic anion transporter [Alphaproteobacteria bacterium]|nr:SulP family inorganic anion transporter [Alphaproteobacteria bacterium]
MLIYRKMGVSQKVSNCLALLKKFGFCPNILNIYIKKYSFLCLVNDLLSGIKIFLLSLPIALSLAVFCELSPLQGIISCFVAACVGILFGGSKYQVSMVALPICVLTFEILSKYQYMGLFWTALFVGVILMLFGLLRLSEVLKHISYAFISALCVYVIISIIINQLQYILEINTIQSSQSIIENFRLLFNNIGNTTSTALTTCLVYITPLMFLRMFFKGFFAFFLYIVLGAVFAYISDIGLIPSFVDIRTIGKEMVSLNLFDNIFHITGGVPSNLFLANSINYAFVISLIIATESCFCTSISSSITGDTRMQINAELISTGIANFCSIAFGGMFVSPNLHFSTRNIGFKAKTLFPTLVVAICYAIFITLCVDILRYIPSKCLCSILIIYCFSEFRKRHVIQYLNMKSNDSYIFLLTVAIAIYFGFIPATIVGFSVSCIFFAKRMIKIKDATVHTMADHDAGVIEFLRNKNGYSKSLNIDKNIMKDIEVIQVDNTLFLNVAKLVEEAYSACGKFPKVVIIYFKNIPYLDGEAFLSLKNLVKKVRSHGAIVLVSGTNGLLLDIINQKAAEEKSGDAYGYIVPNFRDAIQQTVKRLSAT